MKRLKIEYYNKTKLVLVEDLEFMNIMELTKYMKQMLELNPYLTNTNVTEYEEKQN